MKEKINKSKRLICSLYDYYAKDLETINHSEDCYQLLKKRLPTIGEGDIVQLVNGNADVNHAHASHLKCLLSYCLQFKLLGLNVHLIIVNLPSFGNYQNWNHVKIYSYKNYLEKIIMESCGFSPYSTVNVLLDVDNNNSKLDDVMISLMKLSKEHLASAGLIMGMSGGGNFLAGSHGLEWAETIHKNLEKTRKATLMCHANDSILFTKAHTLLSMSKNETLNLFSNSDKGINKSINLNIEQAHMMDHAIFSNYTKKNSPKYSWKEHEFLNQCRKLNASDKLLIVAGPAYLTKLNSSTTRFKEEYDFVDLMKELLSSVDGLKIAFIGDSSKHLMNMFDFLNTSNCLTLDFTNNFADLLNEILKYKKNIFATFPRQLGNAWTNGTIYNLGIPIVLARPNDSEAILPKSAFLNTTKEVKSKLLEIMCCKEKLIEHNNQTKQQRKELIHEHLKHTSSLLDNPNLSIQI